MDSKFFSLSATKPQYSSQAGNLTTISEKEMPGLVNIAYANLKLNKRGSLEPIWHPNANKIGYCVAGKNLISIRNPTGVETFTVEKGDIFFIPQGFIHHIENIEETPSEINFALNHSKPETMFLSKAVKSISDNVFNSTFKTNSGFIDGLKKVNHSELIKTLPETSKLPTLNGNSYKFNIENSNKAILTKGGYVQLGTKSNLPILQGLGILGFGLNLKGIVEPHWHTNAGELVYIVKGKTRITVLSPEGSSMF